MRGPGFTPIPRGNKNRKERSHECERYTHECVRHIGMRESLPNKYYVCRSVPDLHDLAKIFGLQFAGDRD
jgi:hypothetical protein